MDLVVIVLVGLSVVCCGKAERRKGEEPRESETSEEKERRKMDSNGSGARGTNVKGDSWDE